MAYIKNTWVDQNVERPRTYELQNNTDGSVTFIDSFGNVTELGTPVNADNMNHIEEGIYAGSFTKYDTNGVYEMNDLVTVIEDGSPVIYKSLQDNNKGNTLSDTTSWEKISLGGGGGGLEIGDIGIAPLGIDETKGKRRYLNGQIILQEQYIQFTNKVKSAVALYPSLACTESEWQTTATMTVGGQVGKFVVDDNSKTIRLPKIIMPIQGLTDLSKLAEIVEAGLPNVEQYLGRTEHLTRDKISGKVYSTTVNLTFTDANYNGESLSNVGVDLSLSNPIYGNSNTVQQEQIQYPYFIQVATGAETKDEIINEHELVNPYVLLEPKFFETPVYNLSWLISNGSFAGSKAVHPHAYDALLIELNADIAVGTTQNNYTKRGLPVKLATDSYTDYDFVVNPADETFRPPIKVNLASSKAVVGNGMALGLTNGVDNFGICNGYSAVVHNQVMVPFNSIYGQLVGENNTTQSPTNIDNQNVGVTTDSTKSGLELSDSDLYLYFYVGEVAQNTNLVNAGRIEEKLHSLIPDNSSLISGYPMPSDRYIDLTLGASGSTYTAPANGWFYFSKVGTEGGQYATFENASDSIPGESSSYVAWASGYTCVLLRPVKKGTTIQLRYNAKGVTNYFRFIYAEGEI